MLRWIVSVVWCVVSLLSVLFFGIVVLFVKCVRIIVCVMLGSVSLMLSVVVYVVVVVMFGMILYGILSVFRWWICLLIVLYSDGLFECMCVMFCLFVCVVVSSVMIVLRLSLVVLMICFV